MSGTSRVKYINWKDVIFLAFHDCGNVRALICLWFTIDKYVEIPWVLSKNMPHVEIFVVLFCLHHCFVRCHMFTVLLHTYTCTFIRLHCALYVLADFVINAFSELYFEIYRHTFCIKNVLKFSSQTQIYSGSSEMLSARTLIDAA